MSPTRTLAKACLAAGLLAFGSPALAQLPTPPSPELRAAATEVLDEAIAEHKIFLNCSVLSPTNYTLMEGGWRKSIAETATFLAQSGFDGAYISDFTSRALPEALLMPEMTMAAMRAYCSANPNWELEYYQFQFTYLPLSLERVVRDRR